MRLWVSLFHLLDFVISEQLCVSFWRCPFWGVIWSEVELGVWPSGATAAAWASPQRSKGKEAAPKALAYMLCCVVLCVCCLLFCVHVCVCVSLYVRVWCVWYSDWVIGPPSRPPNILVGGKLPEIDGALEGDSSTEEKHRGMERRKSHKKYGRHFFTENRSALGGK